MPLRTALFCPLLLLAAPSMGCTAATPSADAREGGVLLTMHHITSCSECGRPPKGLCKHGVGAGCGSWCQLPPNCTHFDFDAGHIKVREHRTQTENMMPLCSAATSQRAGGHDGALMVHG